MLLPREPSHGSSLWYSAQVAATNLAWISRLLRLDGAIGYAGGKRCHARLRAGAAKRNRLLHPATILVSCAYHSASPGSPARGVPTALRRPRRTGGPASAEGDSAGLSEAAAHHSLCRAV